jgi:hypothetical protein
MPAGPPTPHSRTTTAAASLAANPGGCVYCGAALPELDRRVLKPVHG